MSAVHSVRLQAAWQVAAGGAVWIRAFGRPTGVGPGTRIWLVLDRPAACVATLNGRGLPPVAGESAAWRHDVTAELRERNELRLAFESVELVSADADRVPLPHALGAVSLEIMDAADERGALDIDAP